MNFFFLLKDQIVFGFGQLFDELPMLLEGLGQPDACLGLLSFAV